MIKQCSKCESHAFQDKKHGGKRVFTVKHNGNPGKCTVCGNTYK